MPRTQFQKLFFAFATVVITVHAYVFYSLYVIHGSTFIANTGAPGVLEAINKMGGVPVLGHNIPIWAVLVMCPLMSFIAAILYYPYSFMEFNVIHFLAEWLKLVCFNFPFAFFSQLFFIQPIVRTVFKAVFKKDIEKRKEEAAEKEKKGEKLMPHSESDAIADLIKRMEEIKVELKQEIEDKIAVSK